KKRWPYASDDRLAQTDHESPVRTPTEHRYDAGSPLVSSHERRSGVATSQMASDLPKVEHVVGGSEIHGPIRDEELKLVQRVFLAPGSSSRRIVVFAAVEQSVDVGGICARAAEILAAQVEGSVCLVDANLRQPSLLSCFGRESTSGLADVLQYGGPASGF